jgi:hypothetical protein
MLMKALLKPLMLSVLACFGGALWIYAQSDAEVMVQLSEGELIFSKTAGGVGCAYCHGLDGKGEGTAGVNAPGIVGAQESAVRSSLAGAVPLMTFIKLSEAELAAVVTYLDYLAHPDTYSDLEASSATTDEVDASTSNTLLTINVEITEEGFKPSALSMPLGQRIKLVVRNRTLQEQHLRILGLVPDGLMWLENPGDVREDGVSDADHAAHHAEATDMTMSGAEDHDDHDHSRNFIPWRATSPLGIQPSGDEVHAWTYTYAPSGNMDVVIFTATNTGTFTMDNPLYPEMHGEVTVYEQQQ